jgi:type IV pilus assembly protein PilM
MGKTFFDIFPAPKFINPPVAGLSLSDDGLCFIDLRSKNRKLVLERYGFAEIPDGLIVDGDIKKPSELVKVVSDFKSKHNLDLVGTVLPEEKAFLFRTTLPDMPDDEVREALHFKIEENVPISSDDAIFDFHVVSKDKSGKTVVVTVLPKETVSQYLEVFYKSGLRPILLEVESQSVSRSVINQKDSGTHLIINVGKKKVGLFLIADNLVQFSSTLNFGKSFFDSVFARNSEKKQENFDKETVKVYKTEDNKEEVFKKEIETLLNYWESLGSSHGFKGSITKFISCGKGVLNQSFSDYFSLYFSIPLEIANVWTNVFSFEDYIPDLVFEDSLKYATAIGSAIH